MGAASRVCTSCHSPVPDAAAFCPSCGTPTPADLKLVLGERFVERVAEALRERYRIQRVIGRGGMATVFLADDLRHRRQVAVKVLRSELDTAFQRERFLREIGIAARLRHPHILTLIDSGEAGGLVYYVMPFVEGESLRQRLCRERALPVDDVVRILRDVTDALAYAHRLGLVHRDLKPENVLVADRHALVVDFGVAKAVREAAASVELTAPGASIGTPSYMAPEQYSGGHVDHRADIYAVGVIAYELLSGTRPAMDERPRPLEEVRPGLPPSLAHLVMRCLEAKAGDRWQDSAEVLQRLEALTVRADAPPPRAAHAMPPWQRPLRHVMLDASRVGARRFSRLERWQRLALGLVLLLAVAVLFARPELRLAYHMVKSGLATGLGRPPVASAPEPEDPVAGWERALGVGTRPTVWLGDSGAATVGPQTLDIYGTQGWRSVRLPNAAAGLSQSLATVGHGLWVFHAYSPPLPQRSNGYTVVWSLRRGELVRQDSLPYQVTAAWSGDGVAVVGGRSGELALYENGRWERFPTGRTVSIGEVFGPSREDLYAIGTFAQCGRRLDSLLQFDGAAWRSLDPRPDASAEWVYNGGATLTDGTVVVVGATCPPVRPLILSHRARTSRWERVDAGLPDSLQLRGIWGVSLDDFAVWGGPCHPPQSYCLYQVRAGVAEPAVELRDRLVLGAGRIGGRLHVLTSDGTVWSRARTWTMVAAPPPSEWVVPGVPGNATRPLHPASDVPQSTLLRPRWVPWLTPVFVDSASRIDATRYENRVSVPHEWMPSASQRVVDLTVSPGGEVLAVGDGGLVVTLRDSIWRERTIGDEDLRAVAVLQFAGAGAERRRSTQTTAFIAAGDHNLFLRTAAGEWVQWRSVPPGVGSVTHVAGVVDAETDDTLAVVVGSDAWVPLCSHRCLGPRAYFHGRQRSLQEVTAAIALPDGRLVFGTGPSDPLRGGALFLWAWPDDVAQVVPLPTGIDVRDLVLHGPLLFVLGSGWYQRQIWLRGQGPR